ncbi:hypothetical protein HQQ80_20090 [Microbacteriaceae bacterium VKM Ac-2855]|nr:hypothetical protein [Microbacteriaceae bacterium VKM Ac-2855]
MDAKLPDAHALHARLAADFAAEGVVPSRMFGSDAWLVDGRVVGLMQDHQAVFKLGAGSPQLADTLLLPGAALFEPGGSGRRWKDWVAVPIGSHEHFGRLLAEAVGVTRA